MSPAEEALLLGAMQSDLSPTGKRDYALILLLLRTGCRGKAARHLKWADVACLDGAPASGDLGAFDSRPQAMRDASGIQPDIPQEVWQAVRAYLEASGRLDSIGPEEYIFAPARAPLAREAGCSAQDWAGERPLGRMGLHLLIKKWAQWSGLDRGAVTMATLRHTAAARCVQAALAAGERPGVAMQRDLGWGCEKTVLRCKARIRQKPFAPLMKRRARQPEIRGHAPPLFKPGHRTNVTHGLYTPNLPEMEWLESQGVHLEGRDREVVRLRIVLARGLMLSRKAKSAEEMLLLSNVGSIVAGRLVKLLGEPVEGQEFRAAMEEEVDEAGRRGE